MEQHQILVPVAPEGCRPDNARPSSFLHVGLGRRVSAIRENIGRRLTGVTPEDFPEGTVICAKPHAVAPNGFEEIWQTYSETSVPALSECRRLSQASCIIIFSDPSQANIQLAYDFAESIKDVTRENCPCVLLVCHATTDYHISILTQVVGHSIDDVIIDNSSGLRFTWAVHNRVRKVYKWEEKCQKANEVCIIREDIHETLWCYFRSRLNLKIPKIDFQIDSDLPCICDARLGQFLGKGSYGRVHKLISQAPEVVKLIKKDSFKHVHSLKQLSQHIHIMQILSSEEYKHPNIVQLHAVYHSESQVILRMEDGGPMNLHCRLSTRVHRQLPFTAVKARQAALQMIRAIHHLHTRPNIVHRDLKPENLIVSEWIDVVTLKIADFDTASIRPRVPCRGIIGTFPFASPEVMLTEVYDPYALDVWSMGMVLLEMFCGVGCLEKELQLAVPSDITDSYRLQVQKKLTMKISCFFNNPDVVCNFITTRVRQHLAQLMDLVSPLLRGCLKESSAKRWSVAQCFEHAGIEF